MTSYFVSLYGPRTATFSSVPFLPPTSCLISYHSRKLYSYFVSSLNIHRLYFFSMFLTYLLYTFFLFQLLTLLSIFVFYIPLFLIILLYLHFLLHNATLPSLFLSSFLHWHSILILLLASNTVLIAYTT